MIKIPKRSMCGGCDKYYDYEVVLKINSERYCLRCISLEDWLDTRGGRNEKDVRCDNFGRFFIHMFTGLGGTHKYYLPEEFQKVRYKRNV